MHVELRAITAIHPYPGNPRINDAAVNPVAKSLKEFGFRQPIVVDAAGVIIVGHTRYRAAQKLGLDKVPVHVANDLSEAQVRAYRLADNATNEIATWNEEMLPIELAALQSAEFDLSLLGFDPKELERLMQAGGEQGLTDPDEVPDEADPITQPGDLWLLGEHRLLCGDSTKAEDVARLMDGTKVDLLLTDPPYNVAYVGKTKDALTIENDSMSDTAFREFLKAAFQNAFDAMKPGASYYIWHADSEGYNFRGAVRDCGQVVRQCLIWKKQTLVMGRQDYHWKHEPCLYGWKSGAAHGWYTDRKQTTVLEFDRPSASEEHPTMKPVALFAYQMGNNTTPQGVVLDPFLGSGTTIIAAEQLGRRCFGLELMPNYCDIIVSRWEKFTGRKAERVEAKEKAPANAEAVCAGAER